MSNTSDILVSICCVTYNHARFISQCLDGFLMQKTNFCFEILVHDDCSTDGTTEIIKDYYGAHTDIIIPVFEERNQYQAGNRNILASFLFPKVRGKYIAICEGDDFWTDPYKLQKQVDYMESHADYGMCYTKSNVFSQKENGIVGETGQAFNQLKHLFLYNTIPTPTVLMRTSLVDSIYGEKLKDEIGKNWLMGDYPIWLLFGIHSKIAFIDEVTVSYRVLEESASHSKDIKKTLSFIDSSFDISSYYDKKYSLGFHHDIEIKRQTYKLNVCAINKAWHQYFSNLFRGMFVYWRNILVVKNYLYFPYYFFRR